jgi:hypothetical protein
MLFINPMWDSEAERIGKQKCTPLGYRLHEISDLLGSIGLLLLFGTSAYLGYRNIINTFSSALIWLFGIPFSFAISGSILYRYSWCLAHRRGFRYDCENREASWLENGQQCTYKYK